jgi:hypothetical protein
VHLSRARRTATVQTAASVLNAVTAQTGATARTATNQPAKAPTARVAVGLEIVAAVEADATAAEAANPNAQSGDPNEAQRRSMPN